MKKNKKKNNEIKKELAEQQRGPENKKKANRNISAIDKVLVLHIFRITLNVLYA